MRTDWIQSGWGQCSKLSVTCWEYGGWYLPAYAASVGHADACRLMLLARAAAAARETTTTTSSTLRGASPGLVEAISTQSPLLHTCVTGKAGTGWSPYSSGLQAAPSGLSTQHMEVGSPVALLQLQGGRRWQVSVYHIGKHGSASLSSLALICGGHIHALQPQRDPWESSECESDSLYLLKVNL
jgi:hypothetical protein